MLSGVLIVSIIDSAELASVAGESPPDTPALCRGHKRLCLFWAKQKAGSGHFPCRLTSLLNDSSLDSFSVSISLSFLHSQYI